MPRYKKITPFKDPHTGKLITGRNVGCGCTLFSNGVINPCSRHNKWANDMLNEQYEDQNGKMHAELNGLNNTLLQLMVKCKEHSAEFLMFLGLRRRVKLIKHDLGLIDNRGGDRLDP